MRLASRMASPAAEIETLAEPASVEPDQTREAWLDAARIALLNGGLEAVSIAALARSMGLTRGAFYWHFESRDALLDVLLHRVLADSEIDVFQQLDSSKFEDGVLAVLDAVFAPDAASREASAHRQALYRWAAKDPVVAKLLKAKARQHLQQLQRFMVRSGYTGAQARTRAGVLHALLFDATSSAVMKSQIAYETDLAYLFTCLTGRQIAPAAVSRHLNHTLPQRKSRC